MATPDDLESSNSGKVSSDGRGGFVGRTREIGDLHDSIDGILSGAGRLYLIAGEPGIGKTRLADELARFASGRGVHAVWGRCWEGGGASAYWPWRQIVRSCLRGRGTSDLVSEMGSCAHDLTIIAPEVGDYIAAESEKAPLPSDPEQARFRLFDSIATFLRLVSSSRPLLVLLEDLHAADLPSLLLLRFVARNLNDAGILIVATYRDAELRQGSAHADLMGQLASDSRRITLRGLSEDEVRQLLKVEHGQNINEETIAAVYQATAGNPLFVQEVSRSTLTQAVAEAKHTGGATLLIPNGVRAAIQRHLAPLSATAKQTLTRASVIGREFEFAVLQKVSETKAEELIDAIAESKIAGLANELPDKPGRYRFTHALVRDALYDNIPAAQVAQLHVRVGEILEELHGDDSDTSLSEIAHHFLQGLAAGGDPARAIAYTERAAHHAAMTLAYEEAERLYQMALRASRHQRAQDEAQRCQLLLSLAEVQDRGGMVAAAHDTFKSAARLALKIIAPEMLGRAALGIGTMALDFHTVDSESISLMRRALEELGDNDSALKAKLLAQLAVRLYLSHDRQHREGLIERAIDTARRLGDQRCLLFVLNAKRRALWEAENLEERLATTTEALQLAQACGDRETELAALNLQIGDLTELGDMETAKAALSSFARKAEELRQPYHLWEAAVLMASHALLEGRYEEGEKLANEAMVFGQNLGSADPMYTFSAQMLAIYREKGRLKEVEGVFSAYAERNPGTPVFRSTTAYIRAELHRETEVKRDFDFLIGPGFSALPRRGVDWPIVLMQLSELCCYLVDKSRAPILYELLLPFSERNLSAFQIVCCGSTATYLGKLASVMGRFADAAAHFEQALLFNDRIGARPWLADTQYEYSQMLLIRKQPGDREHAGQLLALSEATAVTIGSVRLLSKIEALTTAHGIELNASAAASHESKPQIQAAALPTKSAKDRTKTPTVGAVAHFQLFREGDYWTIVLRGNTLRLKHAKGFSYIQTLLRSPGREFHSIDLAGGIDSSETRGTTGARSAGASTNQIDKYDGELTIAADLGDAGEMLDATAKAAYRRRLAELNEDLAAAKDSGDVERASGLEDEIEAIAKELRRAVGLMGRDRVASSASERARLNVTRAIKSAIDKVAEHDNDLGSLLARTIRTGTFCCYLQDPANPL